MEWAYNNQYNGTQHIDAQHKWLICSTQHKNTAIILSVAFYSLLCHYAECRYGECCGTHGNDLDRASPYPFIGLIFYPLKEIITEPLHSA